MAFKLFLLLLFPLFIDFSTGSQPVARGDEKGLMNEGGVPYAISNPPGSTPNWSGTPGTYSINFNTNVRGKVEHFDVYGEVRTKYSHVYWTRNNPIDLPPALVERFKGKVMVITGPELVSLPLFPPPFLFLSFSIFFCISPLSLSVSLSLSTLLYSTLSFFLFLSLSLSLSLSLNIPLPLIFLLSHTHSFSLSLSLSLIRISRRPVWLWGSFSKSTSTIPRYMSVPPVLLI